MQSAIHVSTALFFGLLCVSTPARSEVASREGGVRGYLRWATINEPKTYLGMIARVLPFNVVQEQPEELIMTHEQILARLEERGLPTDLVNVLREAPAELDPGEDPDPFGLMKVVEAQADT